VRPALSSGELASSLGGGRPGSFATIASHLSEPSVRRAAINSASIGLEVAVATMLLFGLYRFSRHTRDAAARSGGAGRLPSPALLVPPLIVGVGVLAIPRVAEAAAWLLAASAPRSELAYSLRRTAAWIGQRGDSSVFLIVSLVAVLGPIVLPCWRTARRPQAARAAIDAARMLGAPRWRAVWLGAPSVVLVWCGRFVLVWSLAATNLTPALLASAGADGPTMAPTFVMLADGTSGDQSIAAALALGILVIDVTALTVCSACGAVPRLDNCEAQ
jgi:hypothetical protein